MCNIDRLTERWTKTAVDCYERGCKCSSCLMRDLETECRMKQAVFELVRKFGAPKKETITNRQKAIIDAILNGADTKEDIAKDVGLNEAVTQAALKELYKYAEANGMVFVNRVKIHDFIKWVREEYE